MLMRVEGSLLLWVLGGVRNCQLLLVLCEVLAFIVALGMYKLVSFKRVIIHLGIVLLPKAIEAIYKAVPTSLEKFLHAQLRICAFYAVHFRDAAVPNIGANLKIAVAFKVVVNSSRIQIMLMKPGNAKDDNVDEAFEVVRQFVMFETIRGSQPGHVPPSTLKYAPPSVESTHTSIEMDTHRAKSATSQAFQLIAGTCNVKVDEDPL